MGKGPKRKKDELEEKKKNIKYEPIMPRDLSACKLTLIISWHLKHVIFPMRPYSSICQRRLRSCS